MKMTFSELQLGAKFQLKPGGTIFIKARAVGRSGVGAEGYVPTLREREKISRNTPVIQR